MILIGCSSVISSSQFLFLKQSPEDFGNEVGTRISRIGLIFADFFDTDWLFECDLEQPVFVGAPSGHFTISFLHCLYYSAPGLFITLNPFL